MVNRNAMHKLYTVVFLFLSFSFVRAQDLSNPCLRNRSFHVVVLGSSTSAGTGPSVPDSAWVNRYRKHLQSISASNTVTNLAIGGTTTYHIMPDGFVQPPGRPATNPNNNISKAISLGADAIIINMPSNDAANGFTLQEQMFNFNLLAATATAAHIPVWITTTQPRNSLSAAGDQLQLDVRDSIFSRFGNYAIDFWNGIAAASNDILPQYNSGDGTHLNNAGHAVLVQRVISKNILSSIYDTLPQPDLAITGWQVLNPSACGDTLTLLRGLLSNYGTASTADIPLQLMVSDLSGGSTNSLYDTLYGGTGSCLSDTFYFSINTSVAGILQLQAVLQGSDTDPQNDSSNVLVYTSSGLPQLSIQHDTVCLNSPALLLARASAGDTVAWYDQPLGGSILAWGDSLLLPSAGQSPYFYAEAVRLPLHYTGSLMAAQSSATSWNGVMFNIVALDTLVLDSLGLEAGSTGTQGIRAYTRNGSYVGYENNAAAWTFWGNDTLQVAVANTRQYASFGPKNLLPGDTLAIYLHMQQSGSTLRYRSVTQAQTYSNSHLQLLSGAGIAYTFGTVYSPRDWTGEVYYHYGFNPDGQCRSARVPVQAVLSMPQVTLGNDTVIGSGETLLLDAGNNFVHYSWSNGDTTAVSLIDTSRYPAGTHLIRVNVRDAHGCEAADSIEVTISAAVSLENVSVQDFRIYPNPGNGTFTFRSSQGICPQHIRIYDLSGREVFYRVQPQEGQWIDTGLPPALYILEFSRGPYPERHKWQVTE